MTDIRAINEKCGRHPISKKVLAPSRYPEQTPASDLIVKWNGMVQSPKRTKAGLRKIKWKDENRRDRSWSK